MIRVFETINDPSAEEALKSGEYDVIIIEVDGGSEEDDFCHVVTKDEKIAIGISRITRWTRVSPFNNHPCFVVSGNSGTVLGGLHRVDNMETTSWITPRAKVKWEKGKGPESMVAEATG